MDFLLCHKQDTILFDKLYNVNKLYLQSSPFEEWRLLEYLMMIGYKYIVHLEFPVIPAGLVFPVDRSQAAQVVPWLCQKFLQFALWKQNIFKTRHRNCIGTQLHVQWLVMWCHLANDAE